MAKNDNLTDFLTDVADAIREKKGITGKINPQDFADEITSIQGGGGENPTPDIPIIGDGKVYLHIKIAEKGRMNVPLYWSQTVANGVTIDWGDGSSTHTLGGTGNVKTSHAYSEIGEYTISLNPSSECTLGLGHKSSSYCVMGSTSSNNDAIYRCMLKAVEIGNSVTSLDNYAFSQCYSLANVVVLPGVTTIGSSVFYLCYSLSKVVMPQGISTIGSSAFYSCYSLAKIVMPQGVTSIGDNAFSGCYGMACYDFTQCTSVPSITGSYVFRYKPSDCKMIIPDSLYDTWKKATNWSTYASSMVKASEFNG